MDSKTFYDILEALKNSDGGSFWPKKAQEYGASSAEALRSAWRRERKRRGIDLKGKHESQYHEPRIGVFDIENAPMQVYTFGLWEQNITTDKIISDTYLLSWSAKLLNYPQVSADVVTPEEAVAHSDKRIVKSIWEYLNQCDVVIGHNIKEFDLKKLNTRFLYYGLPPLSNFSVIDTLAVARSNFSFSSNSLKYINQFLGIKQKIENEGFPLWVKCMEGDEKALETMREYNIGDVMATEDLYYRLLPFIKGHPNLALFFNSTERICPKCMGKNFIENGYYYTPTGTFESVRCADCGSVGRLRSNHTRSFKRSQLVS